jgi:negative regulator of sigma-B (phosphoserine phosphatase)
MKLYSAHRLEPCVGETAIGDAVLVDLASEGLCGVFAVIDGLGHGPKAQTAAQTALDTLRARRPGDDVLTIMRAIHGNLRGTRGAAATVCMVDDGKITCCGVGNVALRSHGADIPFVLSPGILGGNVRQFRMVEAKLANKQRIVLHSDGISSDLSLARLAHLDAAETCDSIFRTHRKKNDDGAVLVVDVGD